MEYTQRALEVRQNLRPESLLRYLTGISKQRYIDLANNGSDEFLWYIEKLSEAYKKLFTKEDRRSLISRLERFNGHIGLTESVDKFKIYMSCLYIFGYIDKQTLLTTAEQHNLMPRDANGGEEKKRIFRNAFYSIPFGLRVEDPDIKTFSERLNKHLYSTQEVKTKIYQMIAFNSYTKQYRPRPILLVGAPATGKTKIAKTIALALNRRAEIINLSGRSDVSFLYGMNSTWSDAKPGALAKALSNMNEENGMLIIDEIDKAGGNHSQIIDAFVALLDPEQNYNIQDEFLQIPLDFSKVFIIATANNKDAIPEYVLDRFQVIEIPKYSIEAKAEIIQRYMIEEFNEILNIRVSMTPQAGIILSESIESLREVKRQIETVISDKLIRLDRNAKDLIITEHDVVIKAPAPCRSIGFRR